MLSSKWLTGAPERVLHRALRGIEVRHEWLHHEWLGCIICPAVLLLQLLRSEVLFHAQMRQFVADEVLTPMAAGMLVS